MIPCYNRATLIGDAINSALAYGEGAEIIVVDDGSIDASWECILSFGDKVRGFRIANGGVAAARNFGVAQAQGSFIKFLDSDDRLVEGGLAALLAEQQVAAPHRILFGDARAIGPDGEAIAPCGYGYADVAPPGPISRATLLKQIMSPLLPLYPTQALHRVGGFDPEYILGEDQELAVRLTLAGYEFYRVPVVVAEIREHSGGRLSRTITPAHFERQAAFFASIAHHLSSAGPPLDPNEALALATMIWIDARNAARARYRPQAARLFAMATELVGPVAAAPAVLRPLYRWIDPYWVEHMIEWLKAVSRR
ncbi:MAG TPA: glycosyltransferase family A protein [Sphingomonas sp.]